jgi:hypothetical protein
VARLAFSCVPWSIGSSSESALLVEGSAESGEQPVLTRLATSGVRAEGGAHTHSAATTLLAWCLDESASETAVLPRLRVRNGCACATGRTWPRISRPSWPGHARPSLVRSPPRPAPRRSGTSPLERRVNTVNYRPGGAALRGVACLFEADPLPRSPPAYVDALGNLRVTLTKPFTGEPSICASATNGDRTRARRARSEFQLTLHFTRRLALRAKGARVRDSTVYGGCSSTSAKSSFEHHTQQLAAAVQVDDAMGTWKKITDMKMRLIQDALKATGRGQGGPARRLIEYGCGKGVQGSPS